MGDLKPSRNAQVAELADACDLGSYVNSCGFKSHLEYQYTSLTQLVECNPYKFEVGGSNPSGSTNGRCLKPCMAASRPKMETRGEAIIRRRGESLETQIAKVGVLQSDTVF